MRTQEEVEELRRYEKAMVCPTDHIDFLRERAKAVRLLDWVLGDDANGIQDALLTYRAVFGAAAVKPAEES